MVKLPSRSGVRAAIIALGKGNIRQVHVLQEMDRAELAIPKPVLLGSDSDDELKQEVDPSSVGRCRRQRIDYTATERPKTMIGTAARDTWASSSRTMRYSSPKRLFIAGPRADRRRVSG